MPYFGDKDKFTFSRNAVFSSLHKSGSLPPAPGIFECQVCQKEIVMNREADPLPPCSSCESKGDIWMAVAIPKK